MKTAGDRAALIPRLSLSPDRRNAMLRKAYIEITNVCNLKCSFCPGTVRAKKFMSAEEFERIAGKLVGHTAYIYLHLMGEPLLHPELPHILKTAGRLGFKVMITTNGTLLGKVGDAVLASPAVHKINISLQSFEANDGFDPCNYVNQCATFAKRAGESGKLCEMRLWNRNGADSLNGNIEEIIEKHFPKPWRMSRQSRVLADRVYLEDGDKFDWPDLSTDDRGDKCFCYGLRDQIGVLCDGTVVPCCLDHNGDIPLGNLFETELDEILSSERAKNIYNGFSQRKAVEPLCRTCGYSRRF